MKEPLTIELYNNCKWTKEHYSEPENYYTCWIFKPTCISGIEYDRDIEQDRIEFTYCPHCGNQINHLAEILE